MSQDMNKLIVLAAGGTGGHVFPAEALAAELSARGYQLALFTDPRGKVYGGKLGEAQTVPIKAAGMAGKSLLRKILSVPELGFGMIQALIKLHQMKPACVVGFGGYPSVPTMMAATLGGFKTAIHEQNALLGRANRLLAGRVDRIATSFAITRGLPDGGEAKVVVTGMPVRPKVAEQRDAVYPAVEGAETLNIMVLGGSQGATVLSEVIPAAIALLDDTIKSRMTITQQCREEDLSAVRRAYAKAGVSAELATFFDDVPGKLAQAHLLISRAGASTVAEATAIGRPALLVPYPFAADDHQSYNAHAIDDAGAGWLLQQETFTPEALAMCLESLFGLPAILEKAAASARTAGRPDAASLLADMVCDMIEGGQG